MQEQRREPEAAAGAAQEQQRQREAPGAFLNGDIISNAVNGNDQVFHGKVLPISRLMITA